MSIEGNIGSGKSTLLANLKQVTPPNANIVFVDEPVHEWSSIKDKDGVTILEKFYENQTKYSFPFQMMAFISRLKLLKDAVESIQLNKPHEHHYIVTERSLFTDRMVFAKMLFDDGKIEDIEYQIYLRWFDDFSRSFPVQKVIYVRANPEVCHMRIGLRNRDGESNIPLDYLDNCHAYHEAMLNKTHENCVCADQLVLDGNKNIFDDVALWPTWHSQIETFLQRPCEDVRKDAQDEQTYTLYFDGCSKGNPGVAGAGCVLYDKDNVEVACKCTFVGDRHTNNEAEYQGLITGLKLAMENKVRHLVVKGDSQLVIQQINGDYKCNSSKLAPLLASAKQLTSKFKSITFVHVPRNQNARADELSNFAIPF